MNTTPRSAYCLCNSTNSGVMRRHGPHHVAHTCSNTILPDSDSCVGASPFNQPAATIGGASRPGSKTARAPDRFASHGIAATVIASASMNKKNRPALLERRYSFGLSGFIPGSCDMRPLSSRNLRPQKDHGKHGTTASATVPDQSRRFASTAGITTNEDYSPPRHDFHGDTQL